MVEIIKEDVNRNHISTLLDDIILRIQKYKVEPLLSEEVVDRERRKPEKLKTDDDFLKAITILITFSQNARSDKVQNIWKNTDYFEQAFCHFDTDAVANLDPQKMIMNYG